MTAMPLPYPANEKKRLEFLRSLNLLDTAPDPVFDRVTRLASKLLDVPISLISLVDEDRQWFKSKVGLDADQTPRSQAFCAHAIMDEAPLVVPDASNDERFRANPLVVNAPNIRFYAGVPLRSNDGLAIGTLCVIDSKPKELTPDQLALLKDLASIVTKEIQLLEGLINTHDQLTRSDEQRRAEAEHFRSVFERANVGIAMVAPDGGWLRINSALSDIIGYTQEELLGLTFQDITHPDDLGSDLALLDQLVHGEISSYELEKRYIHKNGQHVWISLNVSTKVNAAKELEYFVAIIKNVQAQKQAELALFLLHQELENKVIERTEELRRTNDELTETLERKDFVEQELRKRESELSTVLDNASDSYISLDASGKVTGWNREAEMDFGWLAAETFGLTLDRLLVPASGHQREQWNAYLEEGMRSEIVRRGELTAARKDGSVFSVEVRMRSLIVNGLRMSVLFLHDISARKQMEAKREYEIHHDALTGLMNRRALSDMLPLAQERARRNGHPLGLLFIDLDGFKKVNDTNGHDAGDQLLQAVAARIKDSIRQTDSAFRLAGDEFVVLLEGPNCTLDPAKISASKLIANISQPVLLPSGDTVGVGASIGLAIQEAGTEVTSAALLKEADEQMYRAKSMGKGTISYQGL